MPTPSQIIKQLSSQEALAILNVLAKEDKRLAQRIAELALARLGEVKAEEVAEAVYSELDALTPEEVWDRAGRKRQGYVEPIEAAYQMLDETLDPHLEQLKKYQALGLSAQANQLCMGLLWALYRFERESASEFKNWAVDAPGECAQTVIKAWQAGRPGKKDKAELKQFADDELTFWGARLFERSGQ